MDSAIQACRVIREAGCRWRRDLMGQPHVGVELHFGATVGWLAWLAAPTATRGVPFGYGFDDAGRVIEKFKKHRGCTVAHFGAQKHPFGYEGLAALAIDWRPFRPECGYSAT